MSIVGKKFQRQKEDFVCGECGTTVSGTGYTNHCPQCLWSMHVDVNPGDRAAACGGMMEPKKVEKKVLRQTTMELPEIIEEIYQALKNQKYEFFLTRTDMDGEGTGGLSMLKYDPDKDNGDILIIVIEGAKKEINAIFSDERIKFFLR